VLYEYKNNLYDVWDNGQDIANANEVIFVKGPILEKGFLGMSKAT
jgi:hypothetical protein